MIAGATHIPLGFEVGTGAPVLVPLAHTAVTGMTQASGKTTTLEALVRRAPVDALAFITKRGEGAFADGWRIRPYFRDRADWQFVDALLSATLQEKNKFLRPWIMKICRTTRTLADVHREVKKALVKAKGIHEGVYTQLDAYLELIVPAIARVDLAPSLELAPGVLNVMDVSSYATPMQMLFIQSALDWVNARASRTVVIVPEAWEMIPEGKGSPVKASAETLVRKGAGIENYIWVDSQDMAGVDKMILRGCGVWLIGVQREANEIKRNLANIPKGIKHPSAAAVAMLERGQFFVCYGQHAIKTYVQPAWMSADEARAHARGDAMTARATPPASRRDPLEDTARHHSTDEDPPLNESEARALREENERLRFNNDRVKQENQELTHRLVVLEARLEHMPMHTIDAAATYATDRRELRETLAPEPADLEAIYRDVKRRLIEEAPGLLKVLVTKPSIELAIERPVITAKGDSLRGRIAQLLAEGFYDRGATAPGTQKELGRRGFDPGPANTYKELDALATLGFVTIEQGKDERSRPRKEYHAVKGMKVNIVERP